MFGKNYKRVLLKISGESFKGNLESGQDYKAIDRISNDILEVDQNGTQICLVVGGGNFYRGSEEATIERAAADYIGMLATVMNALTLQEFLIAKGVSAQVLSSVPMDTICDTYSRDRALHYMDEEKVLIFAGGTGNPYVSTDTAAVYRGLEMKCDAVFKGTQVSGVYDSDPKQDKNAKKYDKLNYDQVIDQNLGVMDLSAIMVAREHKLPIVVFSILKKGEFHKVITGDGNFTIIK